MKKLTLIVSAIFFMASNVYALDLSQFVGEWKSDDEHIVVTVKEDVLRINYPEGDEEDFDILSKGDVTLHDKITVNFSSGSFDSKGLVISAIMDFSDTGVKMAKIPGQFSLMLLEDGKKLRFQNAGIGYSSVEGLTASVNTSILERVK